MSNTKGPNGQEWLPMSGIVLDQAGVEITDPIEGKSGLWHPDDPRMTERPVRFKQGGWWTLAAYKDQFGK